MRWMTWRRQMLLTTLWDAMTRETWVHNALDDAASKILRLY